MGLRMSKPWQPLASAMVRSLPAQLGIYQIADHNELVVKIGYAGGTQPFGLRSALQTELEQAVSDEGEVDESTTAGSAALFRYECTHAYLTRWQELLMVYQADHGELPAGNIGGVGRERVGQLGRLTPGVS